MKQSRQYAPQGAAFPFLGNNSRDPANTMSPQFALASRNIVTRKGLITRRDGLTPFGQPFLVEGYVSGTYSPAATDPILLVVEFESTAGVVYTLAFSTTREYVYDSGANKWLDITYDSAGKVERTGTEANGLQYVICQDNTNKYIIITNGVDKMRKWSGSGNFTLFEPNIVPASGTFKTAKAIAVFQSYFIVAGVVNDSGVYYPYDVHTSVSLDFDEFLGAGSTSATVADSMGPIVRLVPLGDRMVIYSTNSIGTMTFVGGDITFVYEQLIQDTRLLSPRCILNLGTFHVYLSQENFWIFDGTRRNIPIGDVIQKQYRRQVDLSNAALAHAFLDYVEYRMMFVIPVSATNAFVYEVEFNPTSYSQFFFSNTEFNSTYRPTCFGYVTTNAFNTYFSYYIYDTAGTASYPTYDEMVGVYFEPAIRLKFPLRVLGTVGGLILLNQRLSYTDVDFKFDSFYQTKYFAPETMFPANSRYTEIELDIRGGGTLDVECLVGDNTAVALTNTITLTPNWQIQRIPIDLSGANMSIRLNDSSSTLWYELRNYRLWYRPSGGR